MNQERGTGSMHMNQQHGKLKISLIVLYLFLTPIILSNLTKADSPPIIPTLLYGDVKNIEGRGVGGVSVSAKFTDHEGKENTVNTKTVSGGENGEAGRYYFSEGNIRAVDGSEIEIEANGVKVIVNAKEGMKVKAPEIRIEQKKGVFGRIMEFFGVNGEGGGGEKESGMKSESGLEDKEGDSGGDGDNEKKENSKIDGSEDTEKNSKCLS